MKKTTIITLTAIVAVLVVGMLAGCVEKEAPVSTSPSTATILPKTTPTQVVQTATSTPRPETKTWHSVITFSGSTDKTTPPFTIKGDEWQVKWSIRGDPDYIYFSVHVYPRGQTRGYVSNWTCVKSPCSDTQYIYEGAGDYYFDIGAANVDSWKLEVEDYY